MNQGDLSFQNTRRRDPNKAKDEEKAASIKERASKNKKN
jgi:hypothetical protein